MTLFDLVVLGLLAISGLVGLVRGAVREIAALAALLAAAAIAIFSLHASAPLARRLVHPDWLGTAAALVLVFAVAYVVLRIVGGMIARQVQQTSFVGALDRSVGLVIGLGRGLIVLGALNLMFNAATPDDLKPHWIVGSATWPLAQNMGRMLNALAPKGLDIAGRLKPAFDRAVRSATHHAVDDRSTSGGYDARQRGEIDELVEKAR
ncbi:CvpA family protein [Phenylobacterium sp.]|uniref:CvpA family protein n=1 Tax=Phenylobacterium sp. TaxID=1871053 RepID=UPI00286C1669|nr:CvpA family protein [Phenylobacterium sp.]